MQELIDLKLKAINMLYKKIHEETNKQYYKYEEVKKHIYDEIKELEKEIVELKRKENE